MYLAPKGYRREDGNPFTPDGSYDRTWTILIIDAHTQWEQVQGKSPYGCYTVILSPRHPLFTVRLADFLQYEIAHGRKVLLACEEALSLRFTTHYRETTVRPSDPPLLVHSTLLETYANIVRDGCLKSHRRLQMEGFAVQPIGLAPLGEPEDYLDYIMFAAGRLAPEHVVAARLTGKIACDPEMPYAPQARLYFDGHRLVRDGLITRDLTSKVHDRVPLVPYLVCVVTADDVPLPAGDTAWTPRAFSQAADAHVKSLHPRFGAVNS